MKIKTQLLSNGKTATGFFIPDDVVSTLGSGNRPAVCVTVKGHTYRSSIASMGGKYMMGVSAEIRNITGVAAGDILDVDIALDTQARDITIPPDFTKALNSDKKAKFFFNTLSYSNKRRFVYSIETAKTSETRQRRIERSVRMLGEGRV